MKIDDTRPLKIVAATAAINNDATTWNAFAANEHTVLLLTAAIACANADTVAYTATQPTAEASVAINMHTTTNTNIDENIIVYGSRRIQQSLINLP